MTMDLGIEPRIFSWYFFFKPETDALPLRQPTMPCEAEKESRGGNSGRLSSLLNGSEIVSWAIDGLLGKHLSKSMSCSNDRVHLGHDKMGKHFGNNHDEAVTRSAGAQIGAVGMILISIIHHLAAPTACCDPPSSVTGLLTLPS